MSLVWDNFKKGGSEKLAMLALADWCDDKGSRLYPSISTIADKINVSECQARRIIHGFIDQGYLTVIANHSGGDPGKTRHYQLNINMFVTPSAHATPITDATPSMDARDPYHPCALPLAPMLPNTLVTVKETLVNNKENYFLGVSDQVIKDFTLHRKNKKAAITETAINGIKREAIKAGISLESALIECCERGWVGFKADWYNNKASPQKPVKFNASEYLQGHGDGYGNPTKGNENGIIEINPKFLA